MDEEDLFDEFGNYIGPVQESNGPVFPDPDVPEESHEDVRGRFAMVTVDEGTPPIFDPLILSLLF